jgi:hypothetical protein
MRLKAIRNSGKPDLSEEEESKMGGCPWAISHQLANYCFFKFAKDFMPEQQLSEMQVAHYNSISIDTVKKTEKVAISKLKEVSTFKEMSDIYGSDKIIDDDHDPDDSSY